MTDTERKYYLLGQAVRMSLMAGMREPVAYLYNGVRLPKLPEYDESVNSYVDEASFANAYITFSDVFNTYVVDFCSVPLVAVDDGLHFLPVETYPTYSHAAYRFVDGEWAFTRYGTNSENNGSKYKTLSDIVWTSHDILNYEDGTVAFAGSEPVPVYE